MLIDCELQKFQSVANPVKEDMNKRVKTDLSPPGRNDRLLMINSNSQTSALTPLSTPLFYCHVRYVLCSLPGLLKDYSKWLTLFHSENFDQQLEIPGQYENMRGKPLPEYHVHVASFGDEVGHDATIVQIYVFSVNLS